MPRHEEMTNGLIGGRLSGCPLISPESSQKKMTTCLYWSSLLFQTIPTFTSSRPPTRVISRPTRTDPTASRLRQDWHIHSQERKNLKKE
jgi:hypothetical protein